MIDYVAIRVRKWGFNIILNEKFEKQVKKASRIILIVNIVLVFLLVPPPFNFVISLSLIAIEQIMERVIFSFISSVIVPPIPPMQLWRKADFAAVILGGHVERKSPGVVGMYFRNEEAAKKVFEYVHSWNFNEDEDLGEEPHIRISLVINQNKDKYAIFVSPNVPTSMLDELRKSKLEKLKQGKEPHIIVGMMIMCKLFNYRGSGLVQFQKYYKEGNNYYFTFYSGNPQNPQPIKGIKPIHKKHLNILNIEDLTQKDVELFMCKYNIDWDDNSPVPQSMFWGGKESDSRMYRIK